MIVRPLASRLNLTANVRPPCCAERRRYGCQCTSTADDTKPWRKRANSRSYPYNIEQRQRLPIDDHRMDP